MCAQGTDSTYSIIGNTGAIKPIQNLGQCQMNRCWTLKIIEEQNDIHSRTCQFFYLR